MRVDNDASSKTAPCTTTCFPHRSPRKLSTQSWSLVALMRIDSGHMNVPSFCQFG
jgi:hypothetical protein